MAINISGVRGRSARQGTGSVWFDLVRFRHKSKCKRTVNFYKQPGKKGRAGVCVCLPGIMYIGGEAAQRSCHVLYLCLGVALMGVREIGC